MDQPCTRGRKPFERAPTARCGQMQALPGHALSRRKDLCGNPVTRPVTARASEVILAAPLLRRYCLVGRGAPDCSFLLRSLSRGSRRSSAGRSVTRSPSSRRAPARSAMPTSNVATVTRC